MIILPPFMAFPSLIAVSSLNYLYGCCSFCTSTFVDGQLWTTCSDRIPKCSSSSITILISSALMQSGMAIHNSIALMIMPIPDISSYPFVLQLCLHSQSAMNSCGPGLYSILMLYWWIHMSILCSLCDRLATSLEISTSRLRSVITLSLWVK